MVVDLTDGAPETGQESELEYWPFANCRTKDGLIRMRSQRGKPTKEAALDVIRMWAEMCQVLSAEIKVVNPRHPECEAWKRVF